MVAIAVSKLVKMAAWDQDVLDCILLLGDRLYHESTKHLEPGFKPNIGIYDVYNCFYFGKTKITTVAETTKYRGKLFQDYENEGFLRDVLKRFFKENSSGVLKTQKRFYAIWKFCMQCRRGMFAVL